MFCKSMVPDKSSSKRAKGGIGRSSGMATQGDGVRGRRMFYKGMVPDKSSFKRAMGDIGRSNGMATQGDGVREGKGCFEKAWSLIGLAPRGPWATLVAPVAWPHRAMG